MPEIASPAPPLVYGRAHVRRAGRQRALRRLTRIGVAVTATIVLVAGAGLGYIEYRNHQVQRVVVDGLRAVPPSGVENVLLVGSTSRCALKQQNAAFGLCSQGVTGVNSDVVTILHLDPTRRTASILSIPRDLFVPNARSTGPNKIDSALLQGPTRLVSAIQEDFGIPIQHYVELNFDSFQGVVNALGGIKMYFPMPLYDAESSLFIPKAGCRALNGFQALAVVRARHLQYKAPGVTTGDRQAWPHDPQSDLSRILRDHEFLRVLAAAVSAKGLANPLTDNDLLNAVAPQLEVDSRFSLGDMLGTILTFHGVNPDTAPQQTLPVIVDADQYLYDGGDYGDVELTSEPQDSEVIDGFVGVGADRDTMTGKPLPAPGSVTVSVLNGTGVTDQAGATKSALGLLGFDVTGTGDAPPAGSVSETTVVYGAGHEAAAEAVARSLSGSVAMGVGPTAAGAEVTVVTGTDFAVVTPPARSAATGAGVPVTTVPQAAPVPPGTLAPPTPATQGLAPFDPRSCTASGGEGP